MPRALRYGLARGDAPEGQLGTAYAVTSWPFWVAVVLLGAGAHGSWWRVAPWSAWQASVLVEAGVLLVGLVVTAVTGDELAVVLASTMLVGAVLGVAALRGWQSLQRRK